MAEGRDTRAWRIRGLCPLHCKKGVEVSLLCFLVINNFSQFLLTFVLLSSLLENGELYKVSGREPDEVLDYLLSFIGSFSDVVESIII